MLVTTVRLWVHRRMEKTRWRVLAGLLAAVILFAAGAVTITLIKSTPASNSPGTSQGSGTAQGGTQGSGGGALAAVAAARKQAANWVAQQVNPDEVIGCDPVMCAALEAAHIQANRLLVLGPSQPDPLGSEILLDTATLRASSALAWRACTRRSAWQPSARARRASRSASSRPTVRTPTWASLAADVAARKAGRHARCCTTTAIHASPAASHQLIAGQVDTRLLVTLVTLAHSHPVDIISFGTSQAGASAGRAAAVRRNRRGTGPGSTPAASVQTLRSFLSAQRPPYRPSAIVAVQTASRRTVLRVEYPAPSLLGLLGITRLRQGET